MDDKTAILEVLENQKSCWNNGDIDCFMNGYWESDSLQFVSKTGVTCGYQKVLERYKKRYPGQASMGILHFEVIELTLLSAENALLIGSWSLEREADEPKGFFTLTWRKINGAWKIIIDHTS